nr:unnamed protein product [Callosobruchus chinensis]
MHRAKVIASTLVSPAGQKLAAWLVIRNAPALSCPQCRHYNVPAAAEPFLNGSSGQYVEDMYNAWLADPSSVHASWDSYFRGTTQGGGGYVAPPSLAPAGRNEMPLGALMPLVGGSALGASPVSEKVIDDHLAVQAIIRSYQARGHLIADLDPLGIMTQNEGFNKTGSPSSIITRQHKLGTTRQLFT